MDTTATPPPPAWAVLELMGHGRAAGLLYPSSGFGTLLRLDVPLPDGGTATQLLNASAIYRVSFCDEKIARAAAEGYSSPPVSPYLIERYRDEPDEPEHQPDPDDDNDIPL